MSFCIQLKYFICYEYKQAFLQSTNKFSINVLKIICQIKKTTVKRLLFYQVLGVYFQDTKLSSPFEQQILLLHNNNKMKKLILIFVCLTNFAYSAGVWNGNKYVQLSFQSTQKTNQQQSYPSQFSPPTTTFPTPPKPVFETPSQTKKLTFIPPTPVLLNPSQTQKSTQTSLNNEKPHNFRITPVYSQEFQSIPRQLEQIKKFFSIGALYFYKVLKVTYLPKNETIYSGTRCNSKISFWYRLAGFDQNTTDMIIVVYPTNGTAGNFTTAAAAARPCELNRRPTYGTIEFNTIYFFKDLMITQNLISSTIHQIIHLLGFNSIYFSKFYFSSNSDQIRPYNTVVRCEDNNCYIITPKVMQYVRDYFGCYDNTTGALLQPEKNLGHWNHYVYRNEIMTPRLLRTGNRITRLTLSLLDICNGTYENSSELYRCQNSSYASNPQRFDYYGTSSRCFHVQNSNSISPSCFKGECVNGIIMLTIKNKKFACTHPEKWINASGIKIQCPKSFKTFCNYKGCRNWCDGKGLCLNGKCFYPS